MKSEVGVSIRIYVSKRRRKRRENSKVTTTVKKIKKGRRPYTRGYQAFQARKQLLLYYSLTTNHQQDNRHY